MTAEPAPSPDASPLRLAAFDAEDLAIVSTHLQDAVVRTSDMLYLPRDRRFVLVLSRFDWAGATRGRSERCETGLHFERVFRVRRSGFEQNAPRELKLLAVTFVPGPAPSGTVLLAFAEGAALSLEVECLECALRDMGTRWPVEGRPDPAALAATDQEL